MNLKKAAPAKTLGDVAYRTVRTQILSGLLPAGEKLRVEHLRDQLGVGATPLREALSRLAAEKLVRAEGQRGFRVAPMSIAELDDLTENRVLLETRAVELSVQRGDVAWESSLVAAHHALSRADRSLRGKDFDVSEWEERNAIFHDALVAACGSPWLLDLREVLFDQHSRYRAMSVNVVRKRGGGRDVGAEHDEILRAAIARQPKKAASLVAEHVRATAGLLRTNLGNHLPATSNGA